MSNIFKLHLQRFATNTQVTTQQSLSDEMKTYYDKALIEMAQEELIHDQFGVKKPIPKGNGKTVEFRRFDPLPKALTPLTEGVTPDGQNLTVHNLTATVSQFGAYVAVSDMLDLTAIDPVIYETTKLTGQQAGRTLDTVVRDVLHGGTNVLYAPKIVSGTPTAVTQRSGLDMTAKFSTDLLLKARTILRKNKAQKIKKDGIDAYVAIVHPDIVAVLMKDADFKSWNQYTTPEKMYKCEVGSIYGIRIIENTEAKIFNNNTCPVKSAASGNDPATYYSVYSTIVLGANAYGVTEVEGGGLENIVKGKEQAGGPLNQYSTIGWKATQTAERLVEPYMVRIECLTDASATEPAN